MGKKIFDEAGNPIFTIRYIEEVYPYSYNKPFLQFDTVNRFTEEREPIYRYILSSKEFEKIGYDVVAVAIPPEMSWLRRQKQMYVLKKKGSMLNPAEKLMSKLPTNGKYACKIQIDEANLRMRLVSVCASPTGLGPWIEVKNV
jgi:hypothetical protein